MNCEHDQAESTTVSSYFFHGKTVAVLAHGLTKEGAVPDADIERVLVRKKRFLKNPSRHSCSVDV